MRRFNVSVQMEPDGSQTVSKSIVQTQSGVSTRFMLSPGQRKFWMRNGERSIQSYREPHRNQQIRKVCLSRRRGFQSLKKTNKDYKRKYALACLSWDNDPNRFLVELDFDKSKRLQRISLRCFVNDDIKEDEKKEIQELGVKIARFRFNNYKQTHKGKIGRNQLCPCGSGKKYKKCCGKL